ncbi:hypothetical protein Pla110_05610 [Polystyrenella longa]|uniref:Uncharacterized protein n=1 Tax=Polystyrenella longa TaxID=2528007 RepID=A0A518CI14_9PLAN|nr:hypothetical protein [Polystyrenella longa]QDU78857.1 hypothetical protein Pla110_05610 [Polystyrenella longa]
MDITGVSNVLYTDISLDSFRKKSVQYVLGLWPSVIGTFISPDNSDLTLVADKIAESHKLSDSWVEAYFCRDDEMDEFWENNGYEVMPDGEGPFGILLCERFKGISTIEGFQESKPEDGTHPPDPYSTLLISNNLSVIDILTPGLVEEDPFSESIFKNILEIGESLISE